jgi:S1-C subfamily serine protease
VLAVVGLVSRQRTKLRRNGGLAFKIFQNIHLHSDENSSAESKIQTDFAIIAGNCQSPLYKFLAINKLQFHGSLAWAFTF